MLVFAVAVVVRENIFGGVRLISSDAKRDSDVAVLGADEFFWSLSGSLALFSLK